MPKFSGGNLGTKDREGVSGRISLKLFGEGDVRQEADSKATINKEGAIDETTSSVMGKQLENDSEFLKIDGQCSDFSKEDNIVSDLENKIGEKDEEI